MKIQFPTDDGGFTDVPEDTIEDVSVSLRENRMFISTTNGVMITLRREDVVRIIEELPALIMQ
jgi:hypothetical protein